VADSVLNVETVVVAFFLGMIFYVYAFMRLCVYTFIMCS